MPNQNGAAHQSMEIIFALRLPVRGSGPSMPEPHLESDLPQIFLTMECLGRSGEVQRMSEGPGVYPFRLFNPSSRRPRKATTRTAAWRGGG